MRYVWRGMDALWHAGRSSRDQPSATDPIPPISIPISTAIAAMAELGYDLSAHDSKSLDNVKDYAPFDAVVTMGTYGPCSLYRWGL